VADSELDEDEQEARDAAGLGAAADEDGGGGGGDREVLKVQDVDAYWLQRSISKAYDGSIDAPKAQALAEEVFEILQVRALWWLCDGSMGGAVLDCARACACVACTTLLPASQSSVSPWIKLVAAWPGRVPGALGSCESIHVRSESIHIRSAVHQAHKRSTLPAPHPGHLHQLLLIAQVTCHAPRPAARRRARRGEQLGAAAGV
jgi:hypothetical protein